MRLFISYAHVNKPIIQEWIVDILRAGGHDVWFDARLVAGQNWRQQLRDEIIHSDALVYCITPDAIASEWCQWELAKAVELGKPIIPVLMQARTKIPKTLSQLQYVDFSKGPTGDAVARLVGGLQHLSLTQVPEAPAKPAGPPPQSIEPEMLSSQNILMKLLRDPAVQAIIGIFSIAIAIAAIFISANVGANPEPTRTAALSTPATPVLHALRDLEIRSGPSADFARINILLADRSLDILGISEDRLWYQILQPDGRTGWVSAVSSGSRLEGDRGVVGIIIPTLTPSSTSTSTNTPTDTPTLTATATLTDLPTATYTPSATSTYTYTPPSPTLTETPSPTVTDTLTSTITSTSTPTNFRLPSSTNAIVLTGTTAMLTASPTLLSEVRVTPGQYPCEGRITGSSTNSLFVVYSRANTRQSPIGSVSPGSDATLIAEAQSGGRKWYQIVYGERQQTGWVWDVYIDPSDSCPR